MKFFIRFGCVILVSAVMTLMFFKLGETVRVNSSKEIYALINDDNTFISDENQYPLFMLPKSYYVKIIDKKDEYYYVQFKDIKGFVIASDVTLSDKPENPYPESFYFNMKDNDYIFSRPSQKYKQSTLRSDMKLEYIGSIVGENMEEFGGNIWYYVKIKDTDTYGYVYSTHTTGVSGIKLSDKKSDPIIDSYEEIKDMPKHTFVTIIILLCIPMLFATYIMFFSGKTKQKN